ncbi:unnamed protein product [Zymoseptoria tritici ST99CH_3D1]|nr:unnamed protein product [Zymoseptoria tritici ST99CH_3D1]
MLKIHSLLNPMSDSTNFRGIAMASPPTTPAYTSHSSTAAPTPRSETPFASSPAKRQKLVKDAAVFSRGTVRGQVNYPPYECSERSTSLTTQQQIELAQKHKEFSVYPSGSKGNFISCYVRHIPYSSEKKSFLNKTGRDAFDVFQYTFKVPEDPGKEHTVMWDYQIGLVRITPFFKACKLSKACLHVPLFSSAVTDTFQTTPAKALTTNAGLKELAHSITGGALVAQGYWMPYACARAVCLTFCYPIRWALTPIFGPTFIDECLRPNDPGFGRFKIDPEIVRRAAVSVAGPKAGKESRSSSQEDTKTYQNIPRSAPQPLPTDKQLRARDEKPDFKLSSPFESDSDNQIYSHKATALEPLELSPKSKHPEMAGSGWTSINSSRYCTPAPLYQTPVNALSKSLLTEPRYSPTVSWRAAEPEKTKAVTIDEAPSARRRSTRFQKAVKTTETSDKQPSIVSSSSSESDDTDISVSPPKKRKRSQTETAVAADLPQDRTGPGKNVSTKFSAADRRAAYWLLELHSRDAQLAKEPNFTTGQESTASPI